jgi:uncharacterized small protein (DUF1192 family)
MCCSGQPIPPGAEYCSGNLCPISDRNKKANFASIDPSEVLAKVAGLEIMTWNYTFEHPSVRHVGPMAQDFEAAFEVGATDTSIFTIDADGVALASIQALHAEVVTLRSEKERLEAKLQRLESRLSALEE